VTDESCLAEVDFTRIVRAVVAVSGGSDSTALLLLVMDRIAATGAKTKILAVTVDHGLRKEAGEEAGKVSAFCNSIGIPHRTMKWERSGPLLAGIAAAARSARYRLLSQAADEFGAEVIFTGHTLDDQIETVAMRLARGTGPGLAGIAPLMLHRGRFWVARPLLDLRRGQLRSWLENRQTGWIDDPSNVDSRSERARIRKVLGEKPAGHGLDLLEKSRAAAGKRIVQAMSAGALVNHRVIKAAPGLIAIGSAAFAKEDDGVLTAFRALIAVEGGKVHFPDHARALKLLDELKAGNLRRSLGGCVAERLGETLYIWREFRGNGPAPVEAEGGIVWDGRWLLARNSNAAGAVIEPLGRRGKLPQCPNQNPPPQRNRREASAALPVLVGQSPDEEREEVAEFNPSAFVRVLAPWHEFLPVFDLALATAVEKLLCGDGLPEIPEGLKKLSPI
jgi:tRNA(Ile)-lysidine synthase